MLVRILGPLMASWLLPLACLAGSSTIRVARPDPLHRDRPPRVAEVTAHIEGESVGFKIAVDFEGLPQPLKLARATVTLTSTDDAPPAGERGAPGYLEFGFYRDQVEWMGERKVYIDGPRKAGDVHAIPIEFVPLQSQGVLIIDWEVGTDRSMTIAWCFDENGTLVYLGIDPPVCDVVPTVFFEGDSIKILTPGPRNPNSALVDAYYTVVPPFRIGDTSTVCFHVTALHNFPEGFDMELVYDHMSLSGLPEAVKGPVSAGQTQDICLQVVPLPFRDVHELTLRIESGDVGPRKQFNQDALPVSTLFRGDGSLMYVNWSALRPSEDQLSKSLPAGTPETCERIRIDRNPKVNEDAPPGDDQ
jgi:hypothetical protein